MRTTPYQLLMEDCREFAAKVEYPRRIPMWVYPKDKLGERWTLVDLYERVAAGKQLGYEVILDSDEKGLQVRYVEKRPDRPWRLR